MLRLHRDDGVQWVTFDRQDRLNAFTGADYRDLRIAIEEAGASDDVRCVVLTGAGRAFSAGADRSLVDGSASPADRDLAGAEFPRMLDAFSRCPTPVLAAVNGLAVGIGCTLLLHCDLVVASATARFRTPFTALGIPPEAASSLLLQARTRVPDATWMLLASEWVDAELAHSMGLVWRVVPDAELVAETGRAAATLAALDPAAVAATKRLLLHGRAELVAAAGERETEATRALLARRRTDG